MNELLNVNKIIELLENDDISRNKYLFNFIKIIEKNEGNKIISINGNWGSGKTFFINKLNYLINYCYLYDDENKLIKDNLYNNSELFSDDNLKVLQQIVLKDKYKEFNKIVKEKLINSIYFNAWEHDDESDPILSIMVELLKKYNLEKYEKLISDDIINFFNAFTQNKLNVSLENTVKEKITKEIENKEKIKESITNILNNLICENCNHLIIFIDELDRCNPIYALRLLERIKHYFVDDRITIVISTNLNELVNIVSAVYGEKFSSSKYLEKFFDLYLELPKVDLNTYIKTKDSNINYDPNLYISIVEDNFIRYNNMEMRQVDKYTNCMKYLEKNISSKNDYLIDYLNNLINVLFIPYAIGLYISNPLTYNSFSNGNGWNEFEKFVKSNNTIIDFCMMCIYDKTAGNRSQSELFIELQKLYNYLFGFDPNTINKFYEIGDGHILSNSLKRIHDNLSLLGDLADFS